MAASSFTSSSDTAAASPHGPLPHARLGFPWALVLAVAMVAALEVFLHTRNPMSLIAYASDEGMYHAVKDTVAAQGAAEVALVGSSQMREGVVMPTLIVQLEKKLGRPVHVANYAVRGARLDVMAAEVRFLQRQKNPPKLIVVGVSPRDLRSDDYDWPRVALFWNAADWWTALRRFGWPVTDVTPVVLRNEAGRVLASLRYREEIAMKIRRRFGVDQPEEGNPILGQGVLQHEGSRGVRTMTRPAAPMRKIFAGVQSTYLFDASPKPPKIMRGALHELTTAFAADPAGGLLVQMPVAEFLRVEIEKAGQIKQFQAAVTEEAKAAGVAFIPADAEGFQPTNDHFSDLQHFNKPGADAFATWLAGEIAPRLRP